VTHAETYFTHVQAVAARIPADVVENLARALVALRERSGRLFVIGVGGSASNCSHAVNDFRKLCGIEAYTPVDNVAELTARANDEGFDTIFSAWLEVSRLSSADALLIYSVGGGDAERNVSTNIIKAIDLAKARAAQVFGIVGKTTGDTAKRGDIVVVVPEVDAALVTPLSEAFQAVIWHCLVSHPALQRKKTKW
jgi:D-sedoheptulose 7-phosphate isomerase